MKNLNLKTTLSILSLSLIGLTTGTANAAWGHDHGFEHGQYSQSRGYSQQINARQQTQMQRIEAGLRNGHLTRFEFRELMREQKGIRNMERRFRADGHLSHREYARLDRALDDANHNIRDEKHDRQARYGDSPRYR
jgi:hypothetical protein